MLNGNIDIFDFTFMEIYLFAAWCFNLMIIETIYVCMGFSLYINSRIAVEGWDLEIIFKEFAEKLKEKAKDAAIVALFAICLFFPSLSHAEDNSNIIPGEIPLEELQKILESRDFGGKKESWGIRFKNEPNESPQTNYNKLWEFFDKLREFFSYGLRLLLICIIAILLVVLIINLRNFNLKKMGEHDPPSVNILKTRTSEDPEILLEKAISYHEQGNIRLAWGYCAAAAIHSWQIYKEIFFPPNATESDCVNIINSTAAANAKVTAEEAESFSNLIKNWIYFAYAGKHPPEGSFDEAVNSCVLMRNAYE
jgi:hypothetical protein